MKNKGITLIALVITIIVMLILVAVTINISVNGGLFQYATSAAKGTSYARDDEKIQALYASEKMGYYLNRNERFSDEVKKEFGEDTIVEKSEDGGYIVILSNGDQHVVGSGVKNEIIEETSSTNYQIKVYGYDISLAGDISVDIYFEIPEAKFGNSEEKIKITNPLSDTSNQETEISVNKNNFILKNINGQNYYSLKYMMPPKEMSDEITVCAYDGTTQDSVVYTFSMKQIGIETIKNSPENSKLAYYVKTLLNYGAYCQKAHRNYTDDSNLLANKDNELNIEIDKNSILEVMNQEMSSVKTEVKTNNSEYIGTIYNSLLHQSPLIINSSAVINNNNETYTATCNGVETEVTIDSGMVIVKEIIAMEDYNKGVEVKFYNSNKDEVGSVKYVPMDNLRNIMAATNRTENHRLAATMRFIAYEAYMDLIY